MKSTKQLAKNQGEHFFRTLALRLIASPPAWLLLIMLVLYLVVPVEKSSMRAQRSGKLQHCQKALADRMESIAESLEDGGRIPQDKFILTLSTPPLTNQLNISFPVEVFVHETSIYIDFPIDESLHLYSDPSTPPKGRVRFSIPLLENYTEDEIRAITPKLEK